MAEPYGFFPIDPNDLAYPDPPFECDWIDCMIICFDVFESTRMIQERNVHFEGTPYQDIQTGFMCQVLYNNRLKEFEPDMLLPTGDGFFALYNLERWNHARKGYLHILAEIIYLQRLFTQKVENVQVIGSEKMFGRMGAARGHVNVHKSRTRRGGDWLMPVGEPFYLSSRLQNKASLRGAAIDSDFTLREEDLELLLDSRGYELGEFDHKKVTDKLKGFDQARTFYLIGPKPLA